MSIRFDDDAPHEECGVLGISTPHGEGVAQMAFFGLFALQHRGQEAAGIAVSDGVRARTHKDAGWSARVFTPEIARPAHGLPRDRPHPLQHHRRFDAEEHPAVPRRDDARPARGCPQRQPRQRHWRCATSCSTRGFGLTATSDTEVLTLMLAAAGGRTWEERIERTMPAWKGAYSMVILANDRVLAVRDPWGFRPLSVGRLPDGGWAVGVGDVRAADARLRRHQRGPARRDRHPAGRRDPSPSGARAGAHEARGARSSSSTSAAPTAHGPAATCTTSASASARSSPIEWPADADVVVPVPDSSIPAAIGYSRISGLPYNDGLIKNRYIGRTFIEPTQAMRDRGVALKFNALGANLAGKRVVMIDDSLVRGTTAGPLVKLVRDGRRHRGAHAHHLPADHQRLPLRRRHGPRRRPHRRPPHRSTRSATASAADSLAFLSLDGMMRAIPTATAPGYCNACFTGRYPIEVSDAQSKLNFEGVLA